MIERFRLWLGLEARCRHRWDKWIETKHGPLTYMGQREIGSFSDQERVCDLCGLKQLHTATAHVRRYV